MKLLTLIIVVFVMAQELETKRSHKLRRGLQSKAIKQAEENAVDKTKEKFRNLRSLGLASKAVKQAEETVVDKTEEKSRNLRSLGFASNAVRRAEETAVDKTEKKSRNLRSLGLDPPRPKILGQSEETAAEKTNEEALKDQSDSSNNMAYYGRWKAKKHGKKHHKKPSSVHGVCGN